LPWEDRLASIADTALVVSDLNEISCTVCVLVRKLHITII